MEYQEYRYEFPELYNWNLIDNYALSDLAVELASLAKFEYTKPAEMRNDLPGLRTALHKIADMSGLKPY